MGWVVNFTPWPLYPREWTSVSIEFLKFYLNFDDICKGNVVILYSSFRECDAEFFQVTYEVALPPRHSSDGWMLALS
jgi:hypothetical protein